MSEMDINEIKRKWNIKVIEAIEDLFLVYQPRLNTMEWGARGFGKIQS